MNKKQPTEASYFLNRYLNRSRLGRGAFGDVFLIQSEQKLYAIKVIDSSKLTGQNQHYFQYLQGEIECMKNMNIENIVKLYSYHEDQNYHYIVMEYCDQGDLLNKQAQLPGKVYPLADATEILSQVIKGLQELHKQGYLHRDIKMQNVLLKKQGDKSIVKIADFGFAKKARQVGGTVLGTEQYMAPQIYKCGIQGSQDQLGYGYEVDMWAFGVLFYYMLNQTFPFQLNPYWTMENSYTQLVKQAKTFSFRKAVQTTRKKIIINCTQDMQNLFKMIFEVDPLKRITFSEIRQHAIFSSYFPNPSIESKILYKQKFKSKIHNKMGMKNKLAEKSTKNQHLKGVISSISLNQEEKQFPKEKQIIRLELQQINFLVSIVSEIQLVETEIGEIQSLMFAYNLIKYHIVIFRNYLKKLTPAVYIKKYKDQQFKDYKWLQFFASEIFQNLKKENSDRLSKTEMKFQQIYTKCSYKLDDIKNMNHSFHHAFNSQITETEIEGHFYGSYRRSTEKLYQTLKQFLKTHKILKFYYYLCITCICHVFSDLYQMPCLKKQVFSVYLSQQLSQTPIFSYNNFKYYLQKSNKKEYIDLAKILIQKCMI